MYGTLDDDGLGNGPLNATVFNNTVESPGGSYDHGIVLVGGNLSGNTNQVCADINYDSSNNYQQDDKQSAERSPHRSLLPRRWVSAHEVASAQGHNTREPALLMNGIRIRRLPFAHLGFRVVDLVAKTLVLRIQIRCLLPRLQGLGNLVHLGEGIPDMLKHDRVIASHLLRRPQ